MNEDQPLAPVVGHKDRSAGLIIFGILTIILGGLCALAVPLMLVGAAMGAKANGPEFSSKQMLPAALMYGVAAVALVWLGIGSILAKRWARAILLIFSWGWLLVGACAMPFLLYIAAHFDEFVRQGMPAGKTAPALPTMVIGVMVLFWGFIFLAMPLAWALFYQSKHVKMTCEARHPQPCWTDACPLPVLAISLWLGLSAPMFLAMPVMVNSVAPFFGTFLSGLPGLIFYLLLGAAWALAARATYKLDIRGWWLTVAALLLFTISHIVTYSQHDPIEFYQLMGYSGKQLEQLTNNPFTSSNAMLWITPFMMVPFFAYLLYIKRFFRSAPTAAVMA